ERVADLSVDHFRYCVFQELESLPVSPSGEGVAISAITGVILGVPAALPHSLNQGRRDGVAFNGQGVVGIGRIDFVDEAKIRFLVCRESRRLRKPRENLATH